MKRTVKRSSVRPIAWLLGLVIPVGLLVGIFALASPRVLTSDWPFGIGHEEVRELAHVKGLLSEGVRVGEAEVYRLGAGERPCSLDSADAVRRSIWFEAEGYGDNAEVSHDPTFPGAMVLYFDQARPFNAQHTIRLTPATGESIRAKYLEILANELDLPVPEVSFVRVIACGRDLGIHVKEEVLDRTFLAKRRLMDATLFRAGSDPACPQGLFPIAVNDTLVAAELRLQWSSLYAGLLHGNSDGAQRMLERNATIAWLLMRWLEHGDHPPCEAVPFMHRRTTGLITPLFERSTGRGSVGTPEFLMDPMSALLENATIRDELNARRAKLNEERWRVKERFAAADQAWLPLLAAPGDLNWIHAIAERIAEELLDERLVHGDPLAYHEGLWSAGAGRAAFLAGAVVVSGVPAAVLDEAVPLDRVATRYRAARVVGDTLFFGRGKYVIEGTTILPSGKALVLEKGARLTMAPGSGITVQGPFHVRGTGLNPVFVRPMDDGRPYKAIEVRADGRAQCAISGLQMSGGGEGGGAMLSLRGVSLARFNGCEMGTANGPVVEISGGRCAVEAATFFGGDGPLLVLDHVRSELRGSTFRGGRGREPANGVRINGERALVEDCLFQAMSGAAITVGEAAQVLVRNARFDGNAKAIVAMDLGVIHITDNTFLNNGVVFSLLRKDPIQGGARALLYTNAFAGNATEREVDAYSTVETPEQLDPKILSDFGTR